MGSWYLGAVPKERQFEIFQSRVRLAGLGMQQCGSVWPVAAHDPVDSHIATTQDRQWYPAVIGDTFAARPAAGAQRSLKVITNQIGTSCMNKFEFMTLL